jgi:hypothetical protein
MQQNKQGKHKQAPISMNASLVFDLALIDLQQQYLKHPNV